MLGGRKKDMGDKTPVREYLYRKAADLPPSLPLDALGSIPWDSLKHAYGSASDVPDLIRALAGNAAQRQQAENELYGNVFHQGTRYEASPFAIPFFVGLLDRAELRLDLLQRLLAMAIGYEEGCFPGGFDLRAARDAQESIDASENTYGVDAVNTHLAVSRSWSQIVACLDDPDPTVRQEVAHLLAYLPEHATATVDELQRRIAEESGVVRSSHALAIAVLAHQFDLEAEIFVADEMSREGRIGVWCAQSVLGDSAAPDFLIGELSDELPAIGQWLDGSTLALIVNSLSVQSGWLTSERLDRLGRRLVGADAMSRVWIAGALLHEVFADRGPPPESIDQLEPLQRRCLEYLAAADASSIKTDSGDFQFVNWSNVLSAWLLPSTGRQLASYVAGVPLTECLDPPQRVQLQRLRDRPGIG